MKRTILACCVAFAISTMSGCALNPLDALTGKPEVSAQVGAENVKQGIGVTAKNEQKSETNVNDSQIGKVDSSTKKTESIKAGTIQAERIEVNNGGGWDYFGFGFIAAWVLAALFVWSISYRKKHKEA